MNTSSGNGNRSSSSKELGPEVEFLDGIPHMDATWRRKRRMRNQAASHVSERNEVAPTAAVEADSGLRREELEAFLVNFVVEQTGYPADIVEMAADLEADLGIDSIQKAQLFGELREHFDITPSDNLSLDDFPTLAHVRDYLQRAPSAPPLGAPRRANPVSQTLEDLSPPGRLTDPRSTEPSLGESRFAPSGNRSLVKESFGSMSSAPAASSASGSGLSREELESFLVNFVVEQTGYPPDIVEMDADLEADLGIDSIKKAQLFGELREHFDITPSDTLSLDDFPTLAHVRDYLILSSC